MASFSSALAGDWAGAEAELLRLALSRTWTTIMLIVEDTLHYNHTFITPSDVREAGTSPLLVLMLLSALKHIINDELFASFYSCVIYPWFSSLLTIFK